MPCSSSQLLAIDHSTGISCGLRSSASSKAYLYTHTHIHRFAIERDGNSFLIIIRHLSNRPITTDDHLAKLPTSSFVRSLDSFLLASSDTYDNGSLFIRPFREYSKAIHAGTYVCRAENAAGSVQTTPVQLKPRKSCEQSDC